MNRSKKLLILLLALAIVAAGAVLVKVLTAETQEESTAETIFSLDPDQVTRLSWTYAGETIALVDSGDSWGYEADSRFPLDESYLDNMLTALSEISSEKTIEAVEDWDQYGLEDPVCTVEVTTDSVQELKIGDETGLGGQRYLSIGDGNVYLVDEGILDSFTYGLYDLVQMEEIPSMTNVRSLVIQSGGETLEIEHLENSGLTYSDYYDWFAKEGQTYTTLDTDLTDSLVNTVTGLSWEKCASYYVSEDGLDTYGLADPAAVVTVNYTETVRQETGETDENGDPVYESVTADRAFVLELGIQEGYICYARLAGSTMVYQISINVFEAVIDASTDSLLPDDVLKLDWSTVESMEITLDGTTYAVRKEVETTTDEDGNTSTRYLYKLEDQEVDLDDILDNLYYMETSGRARQAAASQTPVLSFRFQRDTESFSQVELTFYPYDDGHYLVNLDREARLLVDGEALDELMDSLTSALS